MANKLLIYLADGAVSVGHLPNSDSNCGWIIEVFPEGKILSPSDVSGPRASVIKDISEAGEVEIRAKQWAVNRASPSSALIATDVADHIVEEE